MKEIKRRLNSAGRVYHRRRACRGRHSRSGLTKIWSPCRANQSLSVMLLPNQILQLSSGMIHLKGLPGLTIRPRLVARGRLPPRPSAGGGPLPDGSRCQAQSGSKALSVNRGPFGPQNRKNVSDWSEDLRWDQVAGGSNNVEGFCTGPG